MVDLTYLKSNVFPGESGGDYNALFGYANRQGRPFQDVRLTDMTINQVLDFTDPSGPYAQSVKGKIGRVATPTGAYQVVGSTLRDAMRGLGLTGNELYNEATQDKIGQWIYQSQGPQAWEAWGGGNGGNTVRVSSRNFSGGPDLEPEQTGLLGFITDPEKRARLALALSGMALNPNQAVQALAQDKLATAETGRINNRTAEWLSQRGRDDLAEAVMRGIVPAKEAVTQAMQPEPQADPMGRLVSAAELRQMFPGEQIEDGLYSIKPDGTASKVGGGGTTVNVSGDSKFGTIPSGYMLTTDPATGASVMVPVPGSPAEQELRSAETSIAQRQGMANAATQTIVGTAAKAREAAQSRTLTGPLGSAAALNPASQNAELYRQVESLKSQAALENINAMRRASPTGGALGGASDADMILLREKSGALDPRSPNFSRDLDDYELTLLQTIHGFTEGTRIFNETRGARLGANTGTNFNGVTVGEPF